ncbi:hypothetical protein BX257_5721 [Streptomyces sp. 3212.3]|nr:hypothetical protein BX257_5721 [Streptomyces sp. 3212.3]
MRSSGFRGPGHLHGGRGPTPVRPASCFGPNGVALPRRTDAHTVVGLSCGGGASASASGTDAGWGTGCSALEAAYDRR